MCQIDYSKSFKQVSNGDRIAMRASRQGKNPDSCTLVNKPGKVLIVATPWNMSFQEAGRRVTRIARLYTGYTITPISMPMGAV